MSKYRQEKLGALLLRVGLVTDEQLQDALAHQFLEGGRLGEVLVRELVISEDQLANALAEQKKIPLVNLAATEIDTAACSLLPPRIARMRGVIPIAFDGDRLVLAMSDPLDIEAIDETELRTGHKVDPAVATASQIRYAIDKYLVASHALEEFKRGQKVVDEVISADGETVDVEVPVVRIVNHMLLEAVRDRASDIHIEPTEHELRVRYRIDGVLQDAKGLPKALQAEVTSRLKVLADLDIAERRRPMDGRIALRIDDEPIDVRLTTYPTHYGEGLALRILDASASLRAIDDIGLQPHTRHTLDRMLANPHGAVLVSGPTGSGKTTTLYSILLEVASPERKIITIEDPIEYRIDGVSQIAVNPAIGLTFATGLRTILRADPDIVMVGEIRDPETATIAIRSALTGHLVLSTLHTNDAPSTLTRLADLGVEPYISSSAVVGAIAQRLVRRLCPHCRRETTVDPAHLVALGFTEHEAETVHPFEAVGCPQCRNTGYRGRIGLFEVMEMNEELVQLRLEHAPAERLRTAAVNAGMRPLRRDGLDKVAAGITSIAEVLRVAM